MYRGWYPKDIVWSWPALCLGGLVRTGCHTIHGAGADIETEGADRSVERATK
jgi:predicted small secreted protein